MRIGIIGAGHIGGTLAKRLTDNYYPARDGQFPEHTVDLTADQLRVEFQQTATSGDRAGTTRG